MFTTRCQQSETIVGKKQTSQTESPPATGCGERRLKLPASTILFVTILCPILMRRQFKHFYLIKYKIRTTIVLDICILSLVVCNHKSYFRPKFYRNHKTCYKKRPILLAINWANFHS